MKICVVMTQGGHLTETLQILDALESHDFFIVTCHSARDDEICDLTRVHFLTEIGLNPFRMAMAFIRAVQILLQERPDVTLSLGSEIGLPFFVLSKLFGMKTIFIESWCRIHSLSLTARLVYPLVDEFWVQWPELLEICGPKARYKGSVI
jgi:beta-1,4-N-acetylglucosaminyltransferase